MQDSFQDMVFSNMKFRDFGADNCFGIEDSKLYKKSLRTYGFKTVDFVTYLSANDTSECKLLFVEAKTALTSESAERKFAKEITDISQKFIDALQAVLDEELAQKENLVIAGA